jgi:iron complex transport system substrate-binding protein
MPVFASLLAASAALRVASLNLCTDEYLLLLARPDEVASVSRLSHDPADSPLWRIGRRYPANRGSLESALPTRPTLLLIMGGGGRASGMIAARMGLKTLDLPFPATLAEVEANMVRVATALGDPARAASWQRRLTALRGARGPTDDAIFLGSGGNSVDSGSLGAQWMRLAGLRQRALPGGRASLELLATRPPEVLLRSTYRQNEHSLGQAWLDHPLARPATSREIPTDGRRWTCTGPLMLAEIERLRSLH